VPIDELDGNALAEGIMTRRSSRRLPPLTLPSVAPLPAPVLRRDLLLQHSLAMESSEADWWDEVGRSAC
jgi:hypothetical protein